ncbi:MAG: pre-peptidase C-terminal domain-containing protein [Myxococcota bacterium]|nr:pre-peptidase C-terminal domain-containing protein [Myxococcota bacterium]
MMQKPLSMFSLGLMASLFLFAIGCSQPSDENNTSANQCATDDDCTGNQLCIDDVCSNPPPGSCQVDSDCRFDEYCASKVCAKSACQSDDDCAEGAICDDLANECRAGCRENSDCEDQVCNGTTNRCEDAGCLSTGCQDVIEVCDETADVPRCIPTGRCENQGQCAIFADFQNDGNDYVCDTAQETCVVKPPCMGDEDCQVGDICEVREGERNRCRPGCRGDDDCSVGEFCDDDGSFLPAGAEYENLVCLRGCVTDDDCNTLLNDPSGSYSCQELKCIPKCQNLDDCSDGQICTGQPRTCQACDNDNQCPATQFCDFARGYSEEDIADPALGLCTDLPPDCPDDGYGDNHQLADAYRIESFPFVADGTMMAEDMTPINQPLFCRENSSEWFVVGADALKVISVRVEYDTTGANLDLSLRGSDNSEIVSSALPPTSDNGDEEVVFGAQNSDDYYIRIGGSIVEKNIPYTLIVDVAEPPPCRDDALEENDTPETAVEIDENVDYENLQVCGTDRDFYVLDVLPDQIVEVTTVAPIELGDVDIYATGPDGMPVAPAVGPENKLYFESNAGGLYTVEIVVADGVGNIDYDLSWRQVPNQCTDSLESNNPADPLVPPNDTCANSTQLMTPGGQTTTFADLNVCTDTDWYEVTLLPLQMIKVTASYDALNSAGLIDLRLRGPNDCDFISSYDTRSRDPNDPNVVIQYLEAQATNGGTYYVTASLDQGRQVNYDLDIEVVEGPPCLEDEFDTNGGNDDVANATVIDRTNALAGQENALIGLRYCDLNEDFYSLDLQPGDKVRWVVKHSVAGGSDLDATIILPDGSNPVSGTTTTDDEEVEYTASVAGTHTLRVYGKSPTRVGYRLLTYITPSGSNMEVGPLDPNCPDPLENNDTRADAVSIAQGTYDLLICGQPIDDDWYKVSLEPGETLTARLDFLHSQGNIDLFLFDDTGSTQTVDRSQTTADFEEVTFTTARAQDMFIKVNTYSGVASNTYTLTTTITPAPPCSDDDQEDDDTAATAASVTAPGLYTELAKCEDDDDWITFDVVENQLAEVYVNFRSTDTELDIFLYDAVDAATPVQSATGTASDSESLVFTAPDDPNTTGADTQTVYTYWVKIDTKTRARLGSYDLLLYRDLDGNGSFGIGEGNADRICPDPYENNDTQQTANLLAAGAINDLRLCWQGGLRNDNDYYSIFVPNGATVTASATFTHANGDIQLDLYRQGTALPVANSRTATDNETVSATNMTGAGAIYTARLYGVGLFTTKYDFEFELAFADACPEDTVGSPSLIDASTAGNTAPDNYPDLVLCENTEDWFEVPLTAGEAFNVRVELNNKFGNIDIEILDDTGAVVATSNTDGNVEAIDYVAATAGDHYLRVFSRNGVFIRNAYDLWFETSVTPSAPFCPDMYERNDAREGAATLNIASKKIYDDMIACGADADWYSVSGLTSTSYALRVFFDEQPGLDLDVTIVDDQGTAVGSATGTGNDAFVTFNALSSRTYFINVENVAMNAIESPYTFILDRTAAPCVDDSYEPNNNLFGAQPLPTVPGSYQLASCGTQDSDFFTVVAANDGDITFTVSHDPADVSLGMQVTGPGAPGAPRQSMNNRITETISGVTAGDTFTVFVGGISGEGIYFLEIEN